MLTMISLSANVNAATITGTIYDLYLQPVQGAVISINSTPPQTIVAKEGNYRLTVKEGVYKLKIGKTGEKDISEEEEEIITITDNGTYYLDYVLFPSIEELEEPELDNLMQDQNRNTRHWSIITLVLAIIIIVFSAWKISKKRPFKDEDKTEEFTKEENLVKEIISLIRKERRISQKDIRGNFPQSEAKISLILSSLEAEGRIKKIKRGRSNIIIFVR